MGTYPPRECGIATFTKDLVTAIDKKYNKIKTKILAMNRNGVNIYNYPKEVIYQIDDSKIEDYAEKAKLINQNRNIKSVVIQHEFGIFGGKYGKYLIEFVNNLEKPFAITFHSVIPKPEKNRKQVVQAITKNAKNVIVMNNLAVNILKKDYGLKNNINVIPHGIHHVKFRKSLKEKSKRKIDKRTILCSFGLISPGKGIEYVIDALPGVISKFPDVLYLIVGETHPNEEKRRGESYRNFLERKIKNLGLQNNIKFYNKYLKLSELLSYLQATDIYIAPCLNSKQATSGTISYALGSGRPVISTPTLQAKDIISNDVGFITKMKDVNSYEKAIIKILSSNGLKEGMGKKAYYSTRHMLWSNVASSYVKLSKKHI